MGVSAQCKDGRRQRANAHQRHRKLRLDHKQPEAERGEPGAKAREPHDQTRKDRARYQKCDCFDRQHERNML